MGVAEDIITAGPIGAERAELSRLLHGDFPNEPLLGPPLRPEDVNHPSHEQARQIFLLTARRDSAHFERRLAELRERMTPAEIALARLVQETVAEEKRAAKRARAGARTARRRNRGRR